MRTKYIKALVLGAEARSEDIQSLMCQARLWWVTCLKVRLMKGDTNDGNLFTALEIN